MNKKKEKLENKSKFEDSKYTYQPAISEMSIQLANRRKSKQNSKNTSKILDESFDQDQTFTYYDTSKILDFGDSEDNAGLIEKEKLRQNLMRITELEEVEDVVNKNKLKNSNSTHQSQIAKSSAGTALKKQKTVSSNAIPVSTRLYQPGKGKRQVAKFNKKGSTAVVVDKFTKNISKSPAKSKQENYKSSAVQNSSAHDSIQAYFSSSKFTTR